jgi:hypothetical protein
LELGKETGIGQDVRCTFEARFFPAVLRAALAGPATAVFAAGAFAVFLAVGGIVME